MLEYKQTLLLLFFLGLTTGIAVMGFGFQWEGKSPFVNPVVVGKRQNTEESFFKTVNLYLLENQKPKLLLNAEEMALHTYRDQTSFFRPKGTAYTEAGQPVDYMARRGFFDGKLQRLSLFENVELKMNKNWIKSEMMTYLIEQDQLEATGSVRSYHYDEVNRDRLFANANRASGQPRAGEMEYFGDVNGRIERLRAYEPPVFYKAQQMRLSMPKLMIHLIDQVQLKKQDLTADSRSGEIFLDNYNKKLKYYVLNDDVKVVEKVQLGKDSIIRRSFSERLEGFALESKIVLTGYPRVFQKQDVIKGNRITLRENTEVVEVEDSNTQFLLGK